MSKDRLLKNNKGFTIVEVILSIVLASSLMICISTIMLSQTSIMSEINQVERDFIQAEQQPQQDMGMSMGE